MILADPLHLAVVMTFFFANPRKARAFIDGDREPRDLPEPARSAFLLCRAILENCPDERSAMAVRRIVGSLDPPANGFLPWSLPEEVIRFAIELAADAQRDDHLEDQGLAHQPELIEAIEAALEIL